MYVTAGESVLATVISDDKFHKAIVNKSPTELG